MNWIGEGAQVPKQVWDKLNERKMDPLIRNRHYGKTHKPMNWIDEKNCNELWDCLKYCKEQNGLPYCKNCGLDDGIIQGALNEAHKAGAQEALAKVEDWVKIHKTITKKKYGEFDAGFITALDDLLHHLQQLKDNKEV